MEDVVCGMGNSGGKEEATVLMYGAPDGGKTTLIYRMKLGELVTTVPTHGFNCEAIDYKKTHIHGVRRGRRAAL